jgi:transposase-like protein
MVVDGPANQPVAGQEYPRDWNQFLEWFAAEDRCLAYLERLRWPKGFVCSRCGVIGQPFRASRGRLMCRGCRHQSTVTAGTVFNKTRTPLRTWFAAIWYVTNQKQGVSALGLQRVLGLGSYQTAWALLHRLRRAMVRPERERLKGRVEVDETFIGFNRPRRGPRKDGQRNPFSALVVIGIEVLSPKGFGRIRLRQVANVNEAHLVPFVRETVEPGSCIRTDGSAAYRALSEEGYIHEPVVHLGSSTPAHRSMAGVHRVASLLKRWLMGTHHGAVEKEQLDYYLDEFTFRFNRRTSRSRGLLFYRLLSQAAVSAPVTYRAITQTGAVEAKALGMAELSI